MRPSKNPSAAGGRHLFALGLALLIATIAEPRVGWPHPSVPPRYSARAGYPLLVGEGWGCVGAFVGGKFGWQCWKAAVPSEGPALRAFSVSWLQGHAVQAGPDRLCEALGGLIRCWQPPKPGEGAGTLWDDGTGSTLPMPPESDDGPVPSYARQRLEAKLVGGTFACMPRQSGLWCAGDNSYGQWGRGGAPLSGPTGLQVDFATLGTWHACAKRPGYRSGDLLCWGRNDLGQLGAESADRCGPAGPGKSPIPCARAPLEVLPLSVVRRLMAPFWAGDLFTCATGEQKLVCWGANRDGWFGTPEACPKSLRAAWPLRRGGTIAAPAAACASGFDEVGDTEGFVYGSVDVGPRGVCGLERDGRAWCRGAIPAPLDLKPTRLAVSHGDDASACALTQEGRLFCWGEGYAPSGEGDRPVEILLEDQPPAPPGTPQPTFDTPPPRKRPWSELCAIHRPCGRAPVPAPLCPKETASLALDDAVRLVPEGQTVAVRGRLGTLRTSPPSRDCKILDENGKEKPVTACCHRSWVSATLGDDPRTALVLDGVGCDGDESRQCCDLPLRGQTVIAHGHLLPADSWTSSRSQRKLGGPLTLCTVPP